MYYFKTKLDLWLLSLKTHRYVAKSKVGVSVLKKMGRTPVFVRNGASWGCCFGLSSPLLAGLDYARRLRKINQKLSKKEIYNGFNIAFASHVAVKTKPSLAGLVDVWVVANLDSAPFVFLHRQIEFSAGETHHKLMTFLPRYRGQGHAGQILGQSLDFYRKFGIKKIRIVAGLSHGGAHWPRVGFVPEDDEFGQVDAKIRENLKRLGSDEKRTVAVYQKQMGIELTEIVDLILRNKRFGWIWEIRELGRNEPLLNINGMSLGAVLLSGTRWRGYLDLDNPVMVAKLKNYIAISSKP